MYKVLNTKILLVAFESAKFKDRLNNQVQKIAKTFNYIFSNYSHLLFVVVAACLHYLGPWWLFIGDLFTILKYKLSAKLGYNRREPDNALARKRD